MTISKLGDALKNKFGGQTGLAQGIEASSIVETAQKALGEIFPPEVANLMRALFIKNRTLTVSCNGSAVAQELRLKQNEVVEKINSTLGRNEIDRVRYLC